VQFIIKLGRVNMRNLYVSEFVNNKRKPKEVSLEAAAKDRQ